MARITGNTMYEHLFHPFWCLATQRKGIAITMDNYVCEDDYYYGICGKGKEHCIWMGKCEILSEFEYTDNICWEYSCGKMILSGSGETICRGIPGCDGRNSYYSAHPYFPEYVKNHTKTLIVQEGITSLDWILFYRFTKLSEVRFPSSLSNIIIESVGEYIDFGVMPLKTLTISEKLSENFLKIATAENIQLIK